ncbi:MAG: DinB family protein [Gemmatimonadetes bacterium]|nr:DinB family protein [Gemmatimonadota bacterium]
MSFADAFLPEFDQEMKTTRSLLERVPFDSPGWKPHTKSTSLAGLASHVANLAGFGAMIASQPEVDMGSPDAAARSQPQYANSADLLAAFDTKAKTARDAIASLADADTMTPWTLRMGDHVIVSLPRAAALRTLMMNHIIHHRGQLSVYLRLNDVLLPSIYGPTADT